jgi:hypothetical protein
MLFCADLAGLTFLFSQLALVFGKTMKVSLQPIVDLVGNVNSDGFSWSFIVVEPDCGRAEFFGNMALGVHYLNSASVLDEGVLVTAHNPDQLTSTWASNPRINDIALVYRKANTVGWTRAADTKGAPAVFKDSVRALIAFMIFASKVFAFQSGLGLASVLWDVSKLADGDYQLAIQTSCVAATSGMKTRDGSLSPTVSLSIDTTAPQMLPMSGSPGTIYFPGDKISVSFTEVVDCSNVKGIFFFSNTDPDQEGIPLDLSCSQNEVLIEFSPIVEVWTNP